jgi:hypothetical protein
MCVVDSMNFLNLCLKLTSKSIHQWEVGTSLKQGTHAQGEPTHRPMQVIAIVIDSIIITTK